MTVNEFHIKEINPLEAWEILKNDPNSTLIDVRTKAEFDFVGIADLRKIGKTPILLPWMNYPHMQIDTEFNYKLQEILSTKSPDQNTLLFLCRSGGRSLQAAKSAALLGYQCYNIINGFEGDANTSGHRGQTNGWKASNLDWRQN